MCIRDRYISVGWRRSPASFFSCGTSRCTQRKSYPCVLDAPNVLRGRAAYCSNSLGSKYCVKLCQLRDFGFAAKNVIPSSVCPGRLLYLRILQRRDRALVVGARHQPRDREGIGYQSRFQELVARVLHLKMPLERSLKCSFRRASN